MSELKIPEITMPPAQPIQGAQTQRRLIPFNGRLITSADPAVIGLSNFRQMTNMRYGDGYPRQIPGMTKINSSVMDATYLKGREIFQFRKRQPTGTIESHVLVQAFNSTLSASQVLVNSTAPPATGEFTAAELWTDDADAGAGTFSDAPDGNVAYCNGVETCLWGGSESRCARFIVFDPAGTFSYDYTDMVTNTRYDEGNRAALSTAGAGVATVDVYVGSIRPLQGVKFYMYGLNASAAVATGQEFDGSSWSPLVLTDGTATAGGTKTLGQTGSITFSSTVSTSKQRFIEGVPMYYYWFTFTGVDYSTSIYYITLDAPFQPLVDYWDGADRSIGAFYKYTTTYTDYSSNCFENTYDTLYADTYANLASLGAYSAGANCVIIGFFERMTAVNISVPSDRTNSTAATICAVDYWDGKEFVTVGTIVDGTSEAGVSLVKSGTISWNPPDPWNVFTKSFSNSTLQLYYYRFRWDQALDATTGIYFASGIPAQRQIRGYSFPLHSQGRLMLCSNTDGERNTVLIGAEGTAQVFNGEDTLEVDFGNSDAINAGCSVFAMYGNTLYNITLFFKDSEMWGLVYSDGYWRKYSISETTGCPAPMTLKTCILPPIEGEVEMNRSVAIWVAADGVYKSDGRHPIKISWDIDDLFDQNSTTHINQSYLPSFSASINRNKMEYRMLVAVTTGTVTTLDVEYVYDLKRSKWYYVDRGTGKKIQCATNVIDGYGNNHEYGLIETGYMERLEYGTTFDGTSITSTLQTGDGPLAEKDMLLETTVQGMLLMMVSKATTTATVTTTHYTDTISTGTDYTMDPTSTQRVLTTATAANSVSGLLHSFKMTITTSDETCGFEPLMLGVFYSPVRDGNY